METVSSKWKYIGANIIKEPFIKIIIDLKMNFQLLKIEYLLFKMI